MTNYYDKVKLFIDKNSHLLLPPEGISASNVLVEQLENELDIRFYGEYLQFIRNWGRILLPGFIDSYDAVYLWENKEIYWVINEAKYCWKKGLDRKLIPILTIDGGEYYCLDPSIDGNQAVYRWDTHFNVLLDKLSDSLFELIWREIEDRVIPNSIKDGRIVNL